MDANQQKSPCLSSNQINHYKKTGPGLRRSRPILACERCRLSHLKCTRVDKSCLRCFKAGTPCTSVQEARHTKIEHINTFPELPDKTAYPLPRQFSASLGEHYFQIPQLLNHHSMDQEPMNIPQDQTLSTQSLSLDNSSLTRNENNSAERSSGVAIPNNTIPLNFTRRYNQQNLSQENGVPHLTHIMEPHQLPFDTLWPEHLTSFLPPLPEVALGSHSVPYNYMIHSGYEGPDYFYAAPNLQACLQGINDIPDNYTTHSSYDRPSYLDVTPNLQDFLPGETLGSDSVPYNYTTHLSCEGLGEYNATPQPGHSY